MGNIRDNRKNGGVVLTEEERKRLENIMMKRDGQSKVDDIIKQNLKKEEIKDNKEKEEVKLRGYLIKGKNPIQDTVDAIIKQQEEKER